MPSFREVKHCFANKHFALRRKKLTILSVDEKQSYMIKELINHALITRYMFPF